MSAVTIQYASNQHIVGANVHVHEVSMTIYMDKMANQNFKKWLLFKICKSELFRK